MSLLKGEKGERMDNNLDNGQSSWNTADQSAQTGTDYTGSSYQSGGYQGGYQNSGYQNAGYQGGYQSQSGGYQGGYQNAGYQSGSYQNGGYQGGYGQTPGYGGYNSTNITNNYASPDSSAPAMTIGDWIITFIIMVIPIVNLVMLFVWAFSSGTNPSKKNWAKAELIIMAVVIVLSIILSIVFGASLGALFSEMQRSGYRY